jgi:opacity protein-like surface antigen
MNWLKGVEMKIIMMMVCVVIQAIYFDVVYAADSTSLGVDFASNREKMPIENFNAPGLYKYASSNRYITAGPTLTVVKNMLFFEASAQTLLSKPRMENVIFSSDSMEMDSAYAASVKLGAVLHESFTPYIGLGYSVTKETYKGSVGNVASFISSNNSKTTHFGFGVRSIIPVAKMLSVYGDGAYEWSDSKNDIGMTVKESNTNRSESFNDNGNGHEKGFAIDAGFEFKPDPRFTIRTLVGIGRTKESGEPEAESISYTLGLFYNF